MQTLYVVKGVVRKSDRIVTEKGALFSPRGVMSLHARN
jgi:hypothetical protein